jgi:glycosyltransferase involved in cell wall biosynthesis
MSDDVIAVIPAFNEAARVGEVVAKARPHVREVVLIDDGSSDQTAAVAASAGATVVRHDQNRGKGAAIVTGLNYFAQSTARYAVFLDADGQHDPAEIPAFIRVAGEADVVVGTRMRDTKRMPFLRKCTNEFTSWLTGRLARQRIPDSQCGYRLVSRAVLPSLKLSTTRFETETEMLIQAGRAGHRIASVPVRTIYVVGRESHIRPWQDTVRFFKLAKKYWP